MNERWGCMIAGFFLSALLLLGMVAIRVGGVPF
ncbi:MAG: hypothetical protein Ct9H300mP11_17690 [Chloroflexota bacterium]|jgi:hypothetical protein|nr:MAG: hypothetical protein Ct9H300mP11_17690 [Chloroflexota bacterium]